MRFLYIAVAGPGKLNDSRAKKRLASFNKWLDELPSKYFIVADNAYSLSHNLLVPFCGGQKADDYNDSYNFHLSQLRIRVEMALGRLTTKWRIFRTDLCNDLTTNRDVIDAASRLHIFVIENDNTPYNQKISDALSDWLVEPLADGPEDNRGFIPSDLQDEESTDLEQETTHVDGNIRRESIVANLRAQQQRRPTQLR